MGRVVRPGAVGLEPGAILPQGRSSRVSPRCSTATAAQWGQPPLSVGHPAVTKQLQWQGKGPALGAALRETAERCILACNTVVPTHGSHVKLATCELCVKGSGPQMSGMGDAQTLWGGCTMLH